jgi:predicted thioesterase
VKKRRPDEPQYSKVETFDEREKISEGTHGRYVINIEKFAARVKKKSE